MLATDNSTPVSLCSLTSQAGRSRFESIKWQARKPVVLARRSRQLLDTTKLVGLGQSDNGSTVGRVASGDVASTCVVEENVVGLEVVIVESLWLACTSAVEASALPRCGSGSILDIDRPSVVASTSVSASTPVSASISAAYEIVTLMHYISRA